MGKIATTSPVWGCGLSDLRALAKITEQAGFDGIFSPEVPPFSAIANAQVFAECTERISVGTWIANIYMRQPVIAAAGSLTIQEITGGRMILGLGVSHKPVNNRYDIDMGDPIESMRIYVSEVRTLADGTSPRLSLKRKVPDLPVYIAGLTKATAELAGEVADGIMPYMCPPAYLATLAEQVAAGAKKAGREASAITVTNGIPCFISTDEAAAVASAKKGLGPYARLPFYQRLIRNVGFGDVVDRIADGANPSDVFTDELIDSVALAGTPQNCRKKLEEHFSAGVGLAILVPGPVGKQSTVEVMEITAGAFS